MTGKKRTVATSLLILDQRLQCRESVPEEIIKDYEEAWKDKASFPPVKAFAVDGELLVVDGFCRVLAAQNVGKSKISVEVFEGTFNDALRAACGANSTHGLRRTNADKRKAANIAIFNFPDESSRAIADLCGVSHVYIQKIRDADREAQEFIDAVARGEEPAIEEEEPLKPKSKPPKQANLELDSIDVEGWSCFECGHTKQRLSDGGNVCASCICPADYRGEGTQENVEETAVEAAAEVETFPPSGDPDPAKLKDVHQAWGRFIRATDAANCSRLMRIEIESITKKLAGLR